MFIEIVSPHKYVNALNWESGMVGCWSVVLWYGWGAHGADMDTDCPGFVRFWLFGQRAVSPGHRVNKSSGSYSRLMSDFKASFKFLSCRTCALGLTSVSSPYGFGFCLKIKERKNERSLSFLSLSVPLSHSHSFFLSNLEAAELLKRVATSFWINMSLIWENTFFPIAR